MARRPGHRHTPAAVALLVVMMTGTVSTALFAQDDKNGPSIAEQLRPTGPVTLSADSAEWVQGGEMKYVGHVSLKSDTLTLSGDQMTVSQLANGQFKAHIRGQPAQLDHAGTPGGEEATVKPVSARADTIDYDSARGLIELRGSAHLDRGGDEVDGDAINYLVAERRIQATGGAGGQVRIVIQPPPARQKGSAAGPPGDSTTTPLPAPAPPPATPSPEASPSP